MIDFITFVRPLTEYCAYVQSLYPGKTLIFSSHPNLELKVWFVIEIDRHIFYENWFQVYRILSSLEYVEENIYILHSK